MPESLAVGSTSLHKTLVGYAAMVAAGVLGFLIIRHYGEQISPATSKRAPAQAAADRAAGALERDEQPPSPGLAPTAAAARPASILVHVIAALAAVVAVGQVLGRALRLVGQPPVIGEVIGGILLGPSLLGRLAPGAAALLFPPQATPYLTLLGELGVILYMFVVGLEFNGTQLAGRGPAALAISHASIVAPFLLGGLLALWIYPGLAPADVAFTPFALFLGVAMSITAFPVLARILADRRLQHTPLGVLALTCAAADDATAWCLLAFVVGVAKAELNSGVKVVALTLAYLLLMVLVVRPLAQGWLRHGLGRQATGIRLSATLVAVLLSALVTEWIGVHAIFGAFILGAIIPHDSRLARDVTARVEPLVSALLLPAFFASTGLRTELGLLAGGGNWLICGAIIAVATLGKFGGTLAAARSVGVGWREASTLGMLMNTRGLMELIVLNVGLQLGVISPALFAMLVIMAIVTTLATAPLLSCFEPNRAAQPGGQAAAS